MKTFNIAVVAGDGVGKEVVPEGLRVLEAAGQRFGFRLQCHAFDWSCETYVRTGKLMPDDGLQQLRPDWFDDVVGSNLFGDILSDLGPAVVGSIGIAPSADLNPEKEFPSCLSPFMLCTGYRGETNCESHWADLVRGNDAAALGPTRGSHRRRHYDGFGGKGCAKLQILEARPRPGT